MEIRDQILQKLEETEQEKNVRIIYACESGSRAWGFPSSDSDYDVRFIYVHPTTWYLEISEKRDVIEMPVGPVLDINGWDLRKSIILLKKSNGPLLEWLTSPIVYRENVHAAGILKEIIEDAFLPKTACWHYLSLAKGMYAKIKASDHTRIKTYLYALRSVLCCLWIIETRTQPPMIFNVLKEKYLNGKLKTEVDQLLFIKSDSNEKDTIKRVRVLDAFIENQLVEIPGSIPENHFTKDSDIFDDAFIRILHSVNEK